VSGGDGAVERDRTAAAYFFDLAEGNIRDCFRRLFENADASMLAAAEAALQHAQTLPNGEFMIPESSPVARGTGRQPNRTAIKQFPGTNGSEHGA